MAKANSVYKVEQLSLDKENPRISYDKKFKSEKEVLDFLISGNNKVVDLLKSIVDNGFIQIGERLIVWNDNGKQIVVEGNRRLSALKLIHGLLKTDNRKINDILDRISSEKFTEIINETTEISVDEVESRKEAAKIMALRHIEGSVKWDANAKLKFYGDYYKFEKLTIHELESINPSDEKNLRSNLRDYLYYDKVCELADVSVLKEPSFFISSRFRKLLLILGIELDVSLMNTYSLSGVSTKSVHDVLVVKNVIKEVVHAFDDGFINSRLPQRIMDIPKVLDNIIENTEEYKYLTIKSIWLQLKKNEEVVEQVVFDIYQNEKFDIKSFFSFIDHKDNYKIFDKNNSEITISSEFQDPGEYNIKFDKEEKIFNILVKPIEEIKIEKIDNNAKFPLNSTIYLEKFFKVTNPFAKSVNLNDKSIYIEVNKSDGQEDKKIEVMDGTKIDISEEGKYDVTIRYVFPEDCSIKKEVLFEIEAKPQKIYIENKKKNYSKEKNLLFTRSLYKYAPNIKGNNLLSQVNDCYNEGKLDVVACCMRTIFELRLHSLFDKLDPQYGLFLNMKPNAFNIIQALDDFVDWFTKETVGNKNFKKVISEITSNEDYLKLHEGYKTLNNLINSKITLGGISQMKSVLHLTDHRALELLEFEDVDKIIGTYNFSLEIIDIIYDYIDEVK